MPIFASPSRNRHESVSAVCFEEEEDAFGQCGLHADNPNTAWVAQKHTHIYRFTHIYTHKNVGALFINMLLKYTAALLFTYTKSSSLSPQASSISQSLSSVKKPKENQFCF